MIGFASHALGRIGYGGGYMIELTCFLTELAFQGKERTNQMRSLLIFQQTGSIYYHDSGKVSL